MIAPRWRTWHGPLVICAVAMAALMSVSAVGLAVDGRTVMGEGVWLKPFKFAASFSLYALTLAWMISQVERWRRTLWWLGTVTVALFVLPEISAITFQAVRGVRSHFNFATTLDKSVFTVMGGAAYLGWALTLALGIFLVMQRRVNRAMAWAIPLGVAISLAGMSVGYLMTAPTPEQAQALAGGAKLITIGAHTVGALDGGPGMPLLGWATGGGDLRVAHFVGLHALQVLPLIALWVRRVPLVIVAAFGYAGLTGLLVWQAQRGQALIHPDATTLLAAGALLAVVAVATAILRCSPARSETPGQSTFAEPTQRRREPAGQH
ncbi:hypothetical protein ACBR40_06930 [Nonomuraea sp. AD125B]|uniref:hypothetical protein n=1 Tax=Nonomuraea sp. AD125B TaxID=3242897 RepID=UPI003528DED8